MYAFKVFFFWSKCYKFTLHTETCNLVNTDLPMNPDHRPEISSVWPTLLVQIVCGKKCVWIIFSSRLSLTAHGLLVELPILYL